MIQFYAAGVGPLMFVQHTDGSGQETGIAEVAIRVAEQLYKDEEPCFDDLSFYVTRKSAVKLRTALDQVIDSLPGASEDADASPAQAAAPSPSPSACAKPRSLLSNPIVQELEQAAAPLVSQFLQSLLAALTNAAAGSLSKTATKVPSPSVN